MKNVVACVAACSAFFGLSACGGGGGGSASVQPIPAPPPVPVDAFPLTKSASFSAIAANSAFHWVGGNTTMDRFGASPRDPDVSISYDASTNSYTVKSSSISATFNSSNLTSSGGYMDTYSANNGTDELKLYNNVRSGASQASAPVQLSYLSYGFWKHNDYTTVDEHYRTYLLFGYPTESASMPKTGSASYRTAVTGNWNSIFQSDGEKEVGGTATFTADFANAKINTDLTLNFTSTGTHIGTYNGTGTISGNQFGGAFTSSDVNLVSGNFQGGFFGPSAAEMGYVFAIEQGYADPYAGTTPQMPLQWVTGVVVGTKQ